jgi:hypothetical protein
VHDLAVDILPPRSVNDIGKKEAGNQEEVRHAKWQRERDNGVQPAFVSNNGFDAERRMHHHDEDDAKALSGRPNRLARYGFAVSVLIFQSSNAIAALATRHRLCYGDATGFGDKG